MSETLDPPLLPHGAELGNEVRAGKRKNKNALLKYSEREKAPEAKRCKLHGLSH